MNQEDLLNAIGMVDERMLEKSEKKPKPQQWKWIAGAVAACLVLVATFALLIFPHGYHTVEKYHVVENLSLEWKASPPQKSALCVDTMVSYAHVFRLGISVEAKVLRIFPDVYFSIGLNQWFRVAELSVENVIVGNNVPSIIYCLLPYSIADDSIVQYDVLVACVLQVGVDGGHPLVNVTTNQLERFGTLFFLEYGHCGVFTNGVLDTSIMAVDGWERLVHICSGENWCESDHPDYPFKQGATLAEVRKAIRKDAVFDTKYALRRNVVTLSSTLSGKVRSAIEQIQTTTGNSYYVFGGSGNADQLQFTYVRYIDGYRTNDRINIDFGTNQVTRTEEQFNNEDIENTQGQQNLADAIGRISPESIKTPLSPKVDEGYERVYNGWTAQYMKVDDRVFCLIAINWNDVSKKTQHIMRVVSIRKIVMPDGTICDCPSFNTTEKLENYLASL